MYIDDVQLIILHQIYYYKSLTTRFIESFEENVFLETPIFESNSRVVFNGTVDDEKLKVCLSKFEDAPQNLKDGEGLFNLDVGVLYPLISCIYLYIQNDSGLAVPFVLELVYINVPELSEIVFKAKVASPYVFVMFES